MIRWAVYVGVLLVAAVAHVQLSTSLPLAAQLALLAGRGDETFADALFVYAVAPRAAVALLVGAAMGLAGSLLQQVTRNPLVSPLTVGAASGAWLALLVGAVVAPAFAATHGVWLALAGSAGAAALALGMAGRAGLGSLHVVLAGMAVHILLGALAMIVALLHDQYVKHLFIWGAGDLTQTDWEWTAWLLPQVAMALAAATLMRRPLTLLRLGAAGASGRGLAVSPFVLAAVGLALWMTASAVTAVGLIGFIGLLAPNLARLTGARTAGDELAASVAIGAAMLCLTDIAAVQASNWGVNLVPSGAAAALIGAPALIWLGLTRRHDGGHGGFRTPQGPSRIAPATAWTLVAACALAPLASILVGPGSAGWTAGWPGEIVWSLRWPRVAAAMAGGAGIAVAGAILQRLLHNPLASPDIVGISSGAALALVGTVILFGGSIHDVGAPVALLGSLVVLAILLLISRRGAGAPAVIALAGISLAALLDAVMQFVLARGDEDSFQVLGWLASSTYTVSPGNALALVAAICALTLATVALARWLALLGAGDMVAAGRGLNPRAARASLLVLASAAVAAVVSVIGPIAFVGLVCPHLARLLGAARARDHVILSAAIGLVLLTLSDWIGRSLFYPMQLPAGAAASVLGGAYFGYLLARRRLFAV